VETILIISYDGPALWLGGPNFIQGRPGPLAPHWRRRCNGSVFCGQIIGLFSFIHQQKCMTTNNSMGVATGRARGHSPQSSIYAKTG